MPISYNYYKQDVKTYLQKHVPIEHKILDVGPGRGTYSELLRDFGYKMDCVEIWEPYIHEFDLKNKYDNVFLGNIVDFDISGYDFIILGDVLEHLTKEQGIELIQRIHRLNKKCLVAVPYNMEQGEYHGNVYETHHQPDLTLEVMENRYPQLTKIYSNNYYGYYITDKKKTETTKFDKSFVLYSTENYFDIITECVKSIREFSKLPIIVYLINSDKQMGVSNTKTIRWDLEIDELSDDLYIKDNGNFYIDRKNSKIYKILTQRPLIVKDALSKYSNTICYVDSDSIATPLVDTIFSYYDNNAFHPYFVEGIYEFLTYEGKGGGGPSVGGTWESTLEHPACELFNVDQSVRKYYRQTGYFVAGQNTYDFLDEWYWMCNNPKVLKNNSHFAPYNEETISNVLLWKYKIDKGLPYIYVNGTLDTVKKMYEEVEYKGEGIKNFLGDWLRSPEKKSHLLFFHGEKNPIVMQKMLHEIKKFNISDEEVRKYPNIDPKKNWGDVITQFILEHFSGKKLNNDDIFHFDDAGLIPFKNGKIIGPGSLTRFIKPNDYVWGTGCIDNDSIGDIPKKIYAVRGPQTREVLMRKGWEVPEIYGDPALLFPKIYNPKIEKKYKYGLIPHYSDYTTIEGLRVINNIENLGVKIINITSGIYEFIDELLECENILSSSLHGLIASDAYGIPNHIVSISDLIQGGDFKFVDYHLSVKREYHNPIILTPQIVLEDLEKLKFEIGDVSISEQLLEHSPWNDSDCEYFPKSEPKRLRVLYLAPHLSTGGMPAYLLKRIESILSYYPDVEFFLAEFCQYSTLYTVQRDRIKQIIPEERFWTINTLDDHTVENSMKVIDLIKTHFIDIVHVDEMIEGFDSFNKVPDELKHALYDNDRTWRVVETCHNIWFDPGSSKHSHPDAYALCTPYHLQKTFKGMPSHQEVFEYPIENKFRTRIEQVRAQEELELDITKVHIINVGLWTSGKNQGEGIEIARHFENTNVEFHFVGNQASNFESYWGPLMTNLPSNVKVWGERNNVETFMKASDILMFNSTWECNPLVIREAASLGLKIIARDLPQYVGMFNGLITPLTDDLLSNVNSLRRLISSSRDYKILDGMTKEFAVKHYNLYNYLLTQKPRKKSKNSTKVNIKQFFINKPFLEITGESNSEYDIKFFDEFDICHYHNRIKTNHWVKLNRQYFTKWNTKVLEDGVLIYDETLNYEGKRVFINFDSSSLGDTISWIPYALEFKNTHKCEVVVSTYWNHLFREVNPELEFVEPGSVVYNIFGQYNIGWYYDIKKEPIIPNTIPLQQAATNILGLPYKEIKPKISYKIIERPYEEKYVTIATNSTAGCKFWTKEGWQSLINYLHSLGYKVINVSKEDNRFDNCEKIKDIAMDYTMNVIHHSEFFVGLSSGLSWLSWAMGKHVVMISNFTEPDHEFTSNCTRITNPNVCNGCWNSPIYKFDKGDWNWCPVHKGTNRQFECHTSITPEMVINQIQHLLK